jgi:hypothetical protein
MPSAASSVTKTSGDLTVTAHVGDRSVLLAFDLPRSRTTGLAGFAVRVTPAGRPAYWLKNRLSFAASITKTRTLNGPKGKSKYADSFDSPYQMFHWVDFPPGGAGRYVYEVSARYFANASASSLKDGSKVTLFVDISDTAGDPALGMTRGYVSSQAFIDRFAKFDQKGQAILWPKKKSIDFSTAPYATVYEYLGAHGRKLVFDFLAELQAKAYDLDMFAYDFNEPDIVRAILALKNKGAAVRLYLDDSKSHAPKTAAESLIAAKFTQAKIEVRRGHFRRFAHDKVMIAKRNGTAQSVLAGSANFSVRGLYVQANSVLVFNDPTVADWYAKAFDQAWTDAKGFAKSPIARDWWSRPNDDSLRISFAPHSDPPFSIADTAKAIKAAAKGPGSSVLFAVMETSGAGAVLDTVKSIGTDPSVLSLGTIEKSGQITTFRGDPTNASVVSFAYLKQAAPGPFKAEVDAGPGQHIHHKFVVCDFNGKEPVVFCGSSNLARGGEVSNGDNLLEIRDPRVVSAYAVEAVRLFDHYRFRSRQSKATQTKPLGLKTDNSWATPFYDAKDIKSREREVFIRA